MKIGRLSDVTGISPRSLRYYEQRGLLASARSSNGYREYDDAAVETVRLIRSLLDLGFSTELVLDVLPCTEAENAEQAVCDDTIRRVTAVRDDIAERVTHLEEARDKLTRFLADRPAP